MNFRKFSPNKKGKAGMPILLIVSVLKSVIDVRTFHKIALANRQRYEIHIIGYTTNAFLPQEEGIFFYPIFAFGRLSPKRLLATLKMLYFIFKLKPNVVLVAASELLLGGVFGKIITKYKLVYDVQENYFLNILHQAHYPAFMRKGLAYSIRSIEKMALLWIDQCLLAETCYIDEMPFLEKKAVVLPNTFKPYDTVLPSSIPIQLSAQAPIKMLIVGTLSEVYGTEQCIFWAKEMSKYLDIELHIMGYAPDEKFRTKLLQYSFSFLRIQTSVAPFAHHQILQKMQEADILLMPYMPNLSIKNRIPTKFYECMALRKPMLIQYNTHWQNFLAPFQAGFFIDFTQKNEFSLLTKQLLSYQFYTSMPAQDLFLWDDTKALL